MDQAAYFELGEEAFVGLPIPNLNDENGFIDDDEIVEIPDITHQEIIGQAVAFPGHLDQTTIMIIDECLSALRSGKNLLVEIPSDRQRRLAILTALLVYQHYSVHEPNDNGVQQVPGQNRPSSSSRKKIYFATKSFEEIKDVLNELKKFKNTGYLQNMSLAVLAHASQLCSSCKDVLLCSSPPFGGNGYRFIDEDGTVHDVSHLKRKGVLEQFCPYRFNRECLEDSNFILCTQEFLISSALRQKHSINLDNHAVIFDDGGNIETACYTEASASIITFKLTQAAECFNSLGEVFNEVNQNEPVENLQQVAEDIIRLSNCLRLFATAINVQSCGGNPATSEELVKILKSNGFEKASTENYDETLRHAVTFMGENDNVKTSVKNREIDIQHVLNVQKLISSLIHIYNSIAKNNMKDFALEISKYTPPRAKDPFISFKVSYANLSAIMEPIMCQTSSLIVSSTCLPPVTIFQRELSVIPGQVFPETVRVTNPEEIHTTFKFAYCGVGPNGVPFQLSHRNQGRETISDEAGEAILNIVHTIPNGIIVFFPSIAALKEKVKCWENDENRADSIWNEIKERKHVFCELRFMEIDDAKAKLKIFRELCTNPQGNRNGAILFALHRGKVSELMDFGIGNVRCIISLGIPYHSIHAFEIKTKEAYILSRGEMNGKDPKVINSLWYNAEAFHNQSKKFAHFFQKEQDWFVGLVFDERMKKKMDGKDTKDDDLLPVWMQREFKKSDPDPVDFNFSRLVGELEAFVNTNNV